MSHAAEKDFAVLAYIEVGVRFKLIYYVFLIYRILGQWFRFDYLALIGEVEKWLQVAELG